MGITGATGACGALHLYPADIRRRYAHELTRLFEDMQRAAAAQGLRACLSLWLAILLDFVLSAIRERMRTTGFGTRPIQIEQLLVLEERPELGRIHVGACHAPLPR